MPCSPASTVSPNVSIAEGRAWVDDNAPATRGVQGARATATCRLPGLRLGAHRLAPDLQQLRRPYEQVELHNDSHGRQPRQQALASSQLVRQEDSRFQGHDVGEAQRLALQEDGQDTPAPGHRSPAQGKNACCR